MFQLSKTPLEHLNRKKKLASPKTGAVATFEGFVRNHNEGKIVIALEYEAFNKLFHKEAEKIFKETKEKFEVLTIKCLHRVGKLSIGEMAVWVKVSAAHRDSAFKACRYIIDEIKTRLPIWKKEYYANGDSGWINCQHCTPDKSQVAFASHAHVALCSSQHLSAHEKLFYSRQTLLPEVGLKGQERLKKSKVLVVGAGGLGTAALQYLAGAGIGTIGICESDLLEEHNLHRQPLYSHHDVGREKCTLASSRIQSLNPYIIIKAHPEKFSLQNAAEITASYDLVLDCTDNFPTKFLLSDIAFFKKIPLIQASIYQFAGQLHVYDPKQNAACLRCLWPRIPLENCVGSCAETGVLGVVPAVLGNLQALEAIKWILNLPDRLQEETLLFDLRDYSLRRIKQKRNPSCPLCGKSPTIKEIDPKHYDTSAGLDIDISQLSPKDFKSYQLIDIREHTERLRNPVAFKECFPIPGSKIKKNTAVFDHDQKYLFFCARGFRSRTLAQELRNNGINSAFSVMHGASAVKKYLRQDLFESKRITR